MIIIAGYTPDDKVPGAVASSEWGAGKISIGAIPLLCVLFGNMLSGGTANLNQRYEVTSSEEADALFGARSELARQCHAALDVTGVTLRAVAVEEVSGGTAATVVFDIGGSWSAGGEVTFQFDEQSVRVAVAASHTPTTYADAVVSALNQAQSGRLFAVAANVSGRVTSTVASLGVRGNQHIAFIDKSKAPSGLTINFDQTSAVVQAGSGPAVTVAGTALVDGTYVATITTGGTNGTAQFGLTKNAVSVASAVAVPTTPFMYTVPGEPNLVLTFGNGTHVLNTTHTFSATAALTNGGQPYSGGAGTDDIEDALDATGSVTNDYIGLAHNDATNVDLVEIECNRKAAFDVGRLENYVTCTHRGLAAGIAIGQTAMNDQLGTCLWVQNGVEHPSRVTARAAALFSVTEGADPNHNYDDNALPGAAVQFADADVPSRSTLKSALNNSLTPLVTVGDELQIVRAICSRSLSGSTPDYRTYDRGDVVVAIRVRKECVALLTEVKKVNPYAGPDVAEGLPPTGTMTPGLCISAVTAAMKEWETSRFNWVEQVDANPVQGEWDSTAKRTMLIVPTIAKTQNHQLGLVVRQMAA